MAAREAMPAVDGAALRPAPPRTIEGRTAWQVEVGAVGPASPVCYAFIDREHGDDAEELARSAARALAQPAVAEDAETSGAGAAACSGPVAFTLVACETGDWNAELSPWPEAKGAYGESFAGEGPATLAWLREACIPAIEGAGETTRPRAIAGYSLAGLFAAWAFLESGAFQGLASCSGSLWFPGWTDWARDHAAPASSVAYLSLGKKEPRVRNAQVAQVGAATEALAAAFKESDALRASTFVWNPGGHFNDPTGRLAAGIAWTVARLA